MAVTMDTRIKKVSNFIRNKIFEIPPEGKDFLLHFFFIPLISFNLTLLKSITKIGRLADLPAFLLFSHLQFTDLFIDINFVA